MVVQVGIKRDLYFLVLGLRPALAERLVLGNFLGSPEVASRAVLGAVAQ